MILTISTMNHPFLIGYARSRRSSGPLLSPNRPHLRDTSGNEADGKKGEEHGHKRLSR